MSSTTNRAIPDFVKLKEVDKRDEKFDELINALLEENGLYRKRIPKGSNSLLRAISDALFFTQNQHEEVKESLIKHLTQLVASNKLTSRLNGFKGNSIMLNDFANNPQLPGFEKTILELVSLLHNARVVLYTMNEDNYLSATIFNNNFTRTIEFLRTKTSHYDTVLPKNSVEKMAFCQNIVLNLVDKFAAGSSDKALDDLKNLNNNEFVNIPYENSKIPAAASPNSSSTPDQFRITRGQHKKSLSDNFNTNFEQMEEHEKKFFDAFMSAAPINDDLFKNVKLRKDTAESGFSINANFDFIDEQNFDGPSFQNSDFAIKNYPILPRKGPLQNRNIAVNETDSPMPTFSKTKFSSHPNVLFNENPSLAEIERIERGINTATTQDSRQQPGASPFYINLSPPGLSPTKFSQRTFSEAVHTPTTAGDYMGLSPTIPGEAMSPSYQYGGHTPSKNHPVSPFAHNYSGAAAETGFSLNPQPIMGQRNFPDGQVQAFSPQHPQFNSLYMKRIGTGASVASGGIQTEEFVAFDQGNPFEDQEVIVRYDQFGNPIREKRKPIILDESQERYTGRLKFFDEHKKYGFIILDEDGSDIFVHFDDLCKANVPKELLRTVRTGNVLRFNFGLMDYIGKYNRSRKAIEIQLIA